MSMTDYDKLNVKRHWKEKNDDKDRYLLCNGEHDIDILGIANDLHIQIDRFKNMLLEIGGYYFRFRITYDTIEQAESAILLIKMLRGN